MILTRSLTLPTKRHNLTPTSAANLKAHPHPNHPLSSSAKIKSAAMLRRHLTTTRPHLRRLLSCPQSQSLVQTPKPYSTPPTSSSSDSELRKYLGYGALLLGSAAATYYSFPLPENARHKKAQLFRYAPLPDDLHTISNWSGTHEVHTRTFLQPESLADLEAAVKDADAKKQKIRPVGSGLSPNGIGLQRAGMVNLALMDRILDVDKERKLVRVEAGARVAQLVDGLKEHGLTLQNFASIREQQVGGFAQVHYPYIFFFFYYWVECWNCIAIAILDRLTAL